MPALVRALAHRSSTGRDADIILVVENGRTVAQAARAPLPRAGSRLRRSPATRPTALADDDAETPDDAPEMQESTPHDTP